MKCVFILIFGCFYVTALDCGIGRSNNDLKKIMEMCIKNNETLFKFLSFSFDEDSDESSSEEKDSVDFHLGKRIRIIRETHETTTKIEESEENPTTVSEETEPEYCIVKCIFNHLGMLNEDGFPNHEKFVEALINASSNQESRDFLQDVGDECFQKIKKEDSLDACTSSTKLVTCLAEKGKTNCEDWPIGELPFKM